MGNPGTAECLKWKNPEKKNLSRDVIEGRENSVPNPSAQNHEVTWGSSENKRSPTSRGVFFLFFQQCGFLSTADEVR